MWETMPQPSKGGKVSKESNHLENGFFLHGTKVQQNLKVIARHVVEIEKKGSAFIVAVGFYLDMVFIRLLFVFFY